MTGGGQASDHPAQQTRGKLQGNVLTPQGWVSGALMFGQHITAIDGVTVDPADNQDVYILPGFIDLHVHGGGGKDIMDAGDAVHVIAAIHARHGTTSMLATTMTSPLSDLEQALEACGDACRNRRPGAARVLGVHLEGPYINPGKLGAQPASRTCATRPKPCRTDSSSARGAVMVVASKPVVPKRACKRAIVCAAASPSITSAPPPPCTCRSINPGSI